MSATLLSIALNIPEYEGRAFRVDNVVSEVDETHYVDHKDDKRVMPTVDLCNLLHCFHFILARLDRAWGDKPLLSLRRYSLDENCWI